MWFKLASATFSTHLGSMASLSNSISIKYTANGFSYTTTSVSKTASQANLVLNLMSGWECKSTPTVSVSGAAVVNGTPTWSNGKLTIAIKPASSKSTFEAAGTIINVSVSGATAISSGGSGGTNYTFTINPNPTSATVTLSATGYSDVSGTGSKSITVANGTKVNWSVSASGYTTRTGSWTISGGNRTENITLVASGEEEPEVSTNYTLTINPTPSTATVTLTASGYTQNGNSITVANGTQVNWTVSASGYTEQNGIWVAEKTETKNITLVSPVTPGESYWVGEKISGKSIGSGKIKSTLNGYLAITDPTYVAELAGKTVEEVAVGLRSATVSDSIPVKIYLVDLNNPAPSDWVLKDTVSGLEGDASTIQTNVLNTPFVVPSGYTLGYYSMSLMGNGELIEGYKHEDSYYANVSAGTSTTMTIGSIDFKVKA